ncbi:Superoxide dismutase [Chloroherpeton thalassium ATCC 35110]|uniref:Superoxide dismutase n=1 Tax=Chloroherpeton thalassium (strain ATCC 35110 / GB-78) TaxID=517418 RepID=B3QX17_CHLT3|nr:superoxide dismutase [Chloroherpeton thalassium]ACF14827.1 Superoxide dismutase [Chloroherpeton thalassium ATCC 35110]
MAYEQPKLPYELNALEPHISANTLEFHYGKHHAAYVTKYNGFVKDTPYDKMPLEDVIKATAGDASKAGIFNNGAQAWNHSFYWNCLSPNGGGAPTGKIADKINEDCGSYENFVAAFKDAAATQFGSGWAWLVLDGGKLKITKTLNAANPMTEGQTTLLTLDVWEHAYYLDYQNRRPDYIQTFLEKLVNWDFVNQNLEAAM